MRTDLYSTPEGRLEVMLLGHSSLTLKWQNKVIQVDPFSEVENYLNAPKADLILITHHHNDHFDLKAITEVSKPETQIIAPAMVTMQLNRPAIPLRNGETYVWEEIKITAVPAYNLVQMRSPGVPFHIKGEGNGYLLTLGSLHLYIAGDTELIPEMKHFGEIDIAFLPKNLPYTMSDSMFIEAARVLNPRVLYPYHYFEIDYKELRKALSNITVQGE